MSKELIEKFKVIQLSPKDDICITMAIKPHEEAKQCTIIALKHTIKALEDSFRWYTPHPSLKEEFEDWKIQSLELHQKQLEQLKTK